MTPRTYAAGYQIPDHRDTPEAQCSRCRQTFDRRDLDERGECEECEKERAEE